MEMLRTCARYSCRLQTSGKWCPESMVPPTKLWCEERMQLASVFCLNAGSVPVSALRNTSDEAKTTLALAPPETGALDQ